MGKLEELLAEAEKAGDLDARMEMLESALALAPESARVLAALVRTCSRRGRSDEASRFLRRGLFHHPDDRDLILEQAELDLAEGRHAQAAAALGRLVSARPDDVTVRAAHLRALRERGEPFEEADATMARALERFPGEREIIRERGRLLAARDRLDEAVEAFLQAGGEDELAGAITRCEVGVDFAGLSTVVQQRTPDSLPVLRALAAFGGGIEAARWALPLLERLLSLEPANEEALLLKIDHFRLASRWSDALAVAEAGLELLLASEQLVLARARLRLEQGQAACAARELLAGGSARFVERLQQLEDRLEEQVLVAALVVYPRDLDLLRELAALQDRLRQPQQALEACARILAIDGGDAEASRGKVEALLELGRFGDAATAAGEALQRDPGSATLRALRGKARIRSGAGGRGVEDLRAARRMDEVIRYLDQLREERRFQEAELLLAAAQGQGPEEAELVQAAGRLRFGQRRYAEAAERFRRASELQPAQDAAWEWHCIALRFAGKLDEASAVVEQGLQRFPESIALLSQVGLVHLDEFKPREAAAAFARVSAVSGSRWARLWRVRALRQARRSAGQGEREGLDRELEGALEQLGGDAAWRERGALHLERAEYTEALRVLARCSPDEQETVFLRAEALGALGRLDEVLAMLSDLRKAHPTSIEVANRLAWLHIERGQPELASELLDEIERLDPSSELVANGRGAVLVEERRYEDAAEAFRKAVRDDPRAPQASSNLAYALLRSVNDRMKPAQAKQRLDEAERACRRALQLDPCHAPAYSHLGAIAFRQERYAHAEAMLKRSCDLDPGSDAHVDLGALYVQMGRFDEANLCLLRACKRRKTDARARLELGNLLLQMEEPAKAVRAFREAVALGPEYEDAHRGLALALMRAGDLPEAGRVLRLALRKLPEPRRWQLHLTLSQALTRTGEEAGDAQLFDEALREAQKAIHLRVDHPAPRFQAGVVRFKLEDYRGALRDWERCLEIDPHHTEAERNCLRVRPILRQEEARRSTSKYGPLLLGGVAVAMLVSLWNMYFLSSRVSATMIEILTPLLLGLLVVAFLLPYLTKLKVGGVEAEISQPKDKISRGPVGGVSYAALTSAVGASGT